MGSFCKDLECTKRSLEISKGLLNKAICEEKEKIASLDKEDYLEIYQIKSQNKIFIDSIQKTITDIYVKLQEAYKKKANCSCISLYNIGTQLAKLISLVEKDNYTYQVVCSEARQYEANEALSNVYCIISKKEYHKDNNDFISDEKIKELLYDQETLCLYKTTVDVPTSKTINKMAIINELLKKDNTIQFYNDKEKQLIEPAKFAYIYDFINMIIDKKISDNQTLLSLNDYDELIDDFIKKYQKEDELKLSRGKNNGK